MHMADALLSPGTGLLMWATAAAALAWASRCLRSPGAVSAAGGDAAEDARVPLMGLLGAFVFAAQMINFSIPGTGSSGHLGGGLLLAILLGPHAALVVVASVLTVQALLFADGGLLALGANVFNLGVLPCWLAYPLVYRPLAGAAPSPRRAMLAALVAAVLGLQLGALAVVLQTGASGISALPIERFLWLMLPIHAAIGIVEGLATAALVGFVQRARPELLMQPAAEAASRPPPAARRRLLGALAIASLLTGGVLSWFASSRPDGLEWSVAQAAGTAELRAPETGLHARLASLQQSLAWLPGYDLPPVESPAARSAPTAEPAEAAWPAVKSATSLAGVAGGAVTLLLVSLVGLALRRRRKTA